MEPSDLIKAISRIQVERATNLSVSSILHSFSEAGIEPAFLVPTQTGLEKSIMDAVYELRELLSSQGLHDFDQQNQGPENKVSIQTYLFSKDAIIETAASLYRPLTKAGDPRIWIYGLKPYADPFDLLAIFTDGEHLFAINCSKSDLTNLLESPASKIWSVYSRHKEILPPEALELQSLLAEIKDQGFIPTKRTGDTGVGFTLETLLGIPANSKKAPDFKGIEIKAGRKKSVASGRTTIFSQVPSWKISRLKGSKDILKERGRYNAAKKRNQLFHEIDATKPNSYGLILKCDDEAQLLHQDCHQADVIDRDVSWEYQTLIRRLQEKHRQTFWVKAETRGSKSDEEFWYNSVQYTSGVNPLRLPLLIESGIISVDYTIKETPTGGAKDQGYLFKIKQADLSLLFKSRITLEI